MGVNISAVLAKAKVLYDDICNQLIASNEVGQLVRLHLKPIWVDSTSTEFNSWGNASIDGRPDIGSIQGGKKQQEVTTEIRMRVYSTDYSGFSQSSFKKLAGAQYVKGQILTIGLMSDYGKVKDCVRADFYISTEGVSGRQPYSLVTDLRPHGFGKDSFFFCFWEKVI